MRHTASTVALTRRSFIAASVSAGMLLTIPMFSRVAKANSTHATTQWSLYVAIHPDNRVTMISPIMDMGQFMRTTGPMILADEMDLDWSLISFSREIPIHMKRDEKGEVGYAHAQVGTGGSFTVRNNWDYLRTAGATVRRMLIEEAAARWNVSPERLRAENSYVIDTQSERRISYGALAEKAALREVDASNVRLKERSQYRIMGRDTPIIDARDMVTGKPIFGIDADYPNALQAVIDRAPALGATIESYDKEAALAVPGVRQIIEIEPVVDEHWPEGRAQVVNAGVAVVADTLWAAIKGRRALKTRWKKSELTRDDSEQQQQAFHRQVASKDEAIVLQNDGDVDAAFASCDLVLDQTYEKPLWAHAFMEPLSVIMDIKRDSAKVVVGHQFPHRAALEIERVTGIDALKVEIASKRMGGGFGRRAEQDFLREAAMLGRKLGQPVKITWMREDDLEHDWFDSAAVMRVRAGLKDGRIVAWHHRQAQTRGEPEYAVFPAGLVPNYRAERLASTSNIRVGPWRAPFQLQWAFATESMLDELAHAAKQDPLEFRLRFMQPYEARPIKHWSSTEIHSGRMAKCYEAAAELAGWNRKRPAGTALGIAGHFTFGTYAACVVEVSVSERNELTIHRAWGAIDCGFAINPNHIRSQMEGGFIDGFNAVLFNRVVVKDGQVQTRNFDAVRWMRMRESPLDIQVRIIDSGYPPTGVGEPPVAPAGAALVNAVFAASGQRIRRLPLADSLVI